MATPDSAAQSLPPDLARRWLAALQEPLEQLRTKISATGENVNAEKRKSLNRNSGKRGGNGSRAANQQVVASAKDRIEVMEALLAVYKDERSAIEMFVRLLACFVIRNGLNDENQLLDLLQPYAKILKVYAPKSSTRGVPTRRNSSKRNNSKRRRSNSQSRNGGGGSPSGKSKLEEIIESIRSSNGAEAEVEAILEQRKVLLGLKYYGSHFQVVLPTEIQEVEPEEGQSVLAEAKEEEEKENLVEPEPKNEDSKVAIQQKEIDGAKIVPEDKSEDPEPKKFTVAAVTTCTLAAPESTSLPSSPEPDLEIPKFTEQFDPLPSSTFATHPDAPVEAEEPEETYHTPPTDPKLCHTFDTDDPEVAETVEPVPVEMSLEVAEKKPEKVVEIAEPKATIETKEEEKIAETFEVVETPEKPAEVTENTVDVSDKSVIEPAPEPGPIDPETPSENSRILAKNPSLALPVIEKPHLGSFGSLRLFPSVELIESNENLAISSSGPIDVKALVDENAKVAEAVTEGPKERSTLLLAEDAAENRYGTFSGSAEESGGTTEVGGAGPNSAALVPTQTEVAETENGPEVQQQKNGKSKKKNAASSKQKSNNKKQKKSSRPSDAAKPKCCSIM